MSKNKADGYRVLMLVSDAYGGHGGIALYNRDVALALSGDSAVSEIVIVPRLIQYDVGALPPKVRIVEKAARGARAFVASVLGQALRGGRFDLIYCGHINLAPLAALASRLAGAPWSLTLYGIDGWSRTGRRLTDRAAGRADRYHFVSQVTADRFRAIWPVDAARCAIVPNGIHLDDYAVGPKPAALEQRYGLAGKTVLMTLGRLSASEQAKGFDRMIRLLPRLAEDLPEVRYLICGDGDDRPHLERLAAQEGVTDRVVFAGMVDEAEKADHYRLSDVYVMPSHGEGFGYVFLEAMACGVPVVASAIDGGREAVREGLLGQMVDPNEPEQVRAAILAALAAPRGIPEGIDHFNFEKTSARITGSLLPLMAARPAGGL